MHSGLPQLPFLTSSEPLSLLAYLPAWDTHMVHEAVSWFKFGSACSLEFQEAEFNDPAAMSREDIVPFKQIPESPEPC